MAFSEYPKFMFREGHNPRLAGSREAELRFIDEGWSVNPPGTPVDDTDDDGVPEYPYLVVNGERVRPFRRIVAGRVQIGWQQQVGDKWEDSSSRVL